MDPGVYIVGAECLAKVHVQRFLTSEERFVCECAIVFVRALALMRAFVWLWALATWRYVECSFKRFQLLPNYGQVQNGRHRSSSMKSKQVNAKRSQSTSLAILILHPLFKFRLPFSKWRKPNLKISVLLILILLSLFHTHTCNSKTTCTCIWCVQILYIPNNWSVTGHVPFLFGAVYKLRLASNGQEAVFLWARYSHLATYLALVYVF